MGNLMTTRGLHKRQVLLNPDREGATIDALRHTSALVMYETNGLHPSKDDAEYVTRDADVMRQAAESKLLVVYLLRADTRQDALDKFRERAGLGLADLDFSVDGGDRVINMNEIAEDPGLNDEQDVADAVDDGEEAEGKDAVSCLDVNRRCPNSLVGRVASEEFVAARATLEKKKAELKVFTDTLADRAPEEPVRPTY